MDYKITKNSIQVVGIGKTNLLKKHCLYPELNGMGSADSKYPQLMRVN